MRATFFVLSWIAERLPHLIREIADRGHEIASHGCNHDRPREQDINEFYRDLVDSKKCSGRHYWDARIRLSERPVFRSILISWKVVADVGYLYDSSFNSFYPNKRHGKLLSVCYERKGIAHKIRPKLYELPVS